MRSGTMIATQRIEKIFTEAYGVVQMKIDTYRSQKKPSYGLVVPAGTDLSSFEGVIAAGIASLQPWIKGSTHELKKVYHGDLLNFIQGEIEKNGASLVKVETRFAEILGSH
jgi:hypothetical protein